MKKTFFLIVLLMMISSCSDTFIMPYNHLYSIDGFIVWTSHTIVPSPDKVTNNASFDLFLFNKKDAEVYWDNGKYHFRFKKEPVNVIVLQATTSETRQPSALFYYTFKNNNQLATIVNYSDGITKFLIGTFLVKKGNIWRKYGKYANETFNSKDVYKITFNGRDSVLIKPIWGFDYVEAMEIKDPLDDWFK